MGAFTWIQTPSGNWAEKGFKDEVMNINIIYIISIQCKEIWTNIQQKFRLPYLCALLQYTELREGSN